MPRARRRPPRDKEEAIRLFAEHHILDVRLGKRGQIQKVKHIQFGWIEPETYYQLQKMHDALPIVEKVVEGGYRMKAALWNSYLEIEVAGTGVKLPLGVAIVAGALFLWSERMQQGKEAEAWLILASLVLPFGEILLIAEGVIDLRGALDNFKAFLKDVDEGKFPIAGKKVPIVRPVMNPRAWWRAIFPWP